MAPEDRKTFRVVYATDGSGSAKRAAPLLRQLVLPVTQHLTVLTVAPHSMLSGARPDPAFLAKVTPAARRHALLESEEEAQRAVLELDPGVEVEAVARWGNPIAEILRASRRPAANLVVLGAKGHSNLGLILLGSVSQGVVQNSTVPVLIVRPETDRVRRVLIGYDDSPESRRSMAYLSRLDFPSTVQFIMSYVITPLPRGGRSRKAMAAANEAHREHQMAAQRALESAVKSLRDRGLTVATEILNGAAAPELDKSARHHHADIIVVGSRKPAPARHYLLGSTAEKLVRHAAASVLVVR